MRLSYFLVLIPALAAHAHVVKRNNGGNPNVTNPSDVAILNYALGLANLQNAFYNQSLAQFDEGAFNSSGYGPNVRSYFIQISQNKQAQVNLIAQTLGADATPYCSYNFNVNNVTNFTQTSQVIENIGTAAYIGSIGDLTNSTYQTWAASILSNNARTASWVSTINGVEPWDGPFDSPLTPQEVTTLTAPYIISCPPNSTNPFQPGASLTVSQVVAGSNGTFSFPNQNSAGSPLYAVFFQGLNKLVVPLSNDSATVPTNLTGIVFVEVANSANDVSDENVVAGPTFINLSIPQNGTTNGTSPVPAPAPPISATSSSSPISESSTSSAASSSTSESATSTVTQSVTSSAESSATSASESPSSSATETSTVTETATDTASEQSTITVVQTATTSA